MGERFECVLCWHERFADTTKAFLPVSMFCDPLQGVQVVLRDFRGRSRRGRRILAHPRLHKYHSQTEMYRIHANVTTAHLLRDTTRQP